MKLKKEKGITLIALVITIIVLIILAGVSINLLLGQYGVITKAKEAREEYEIGQIKEKIELEISNILIENTCENKEMSFEKLKGLEDIGLKIYIIEDEILVGEYQNYIVEIQNDYTITVKDKKSYKETIVIAINDIAADGFVITIKRGELAEGFKYYVDGVAQNTEITTEKELKITGLNENTKYRDIYVEAYYNDMNEKIVSNKTEVITKAKWRILLDKANIPYESYNSFSEALTDENSNKIIESTNAMDYIGDMFSNLSDFETIANNSILMSAICENSNTRLAMYNNYTITETILASSEVALNAMKSSSRYEVIKKSISKYAGHISFTNMYTDKAYVLGVSQDRNTDAGFKTESGEYLSVSGGILKPTANLTYGTTGLIYSINKFASTVKLDPYGRDPSQSSISIDINGYISIFKI